MKPGSHVHFIGIGGSGLSAIARVLQESGYSVSGSDRQVSPLAQSLQLAGVQVSFEHRPENVSGADLVIRSSAVRDDNEEVQAARLAGIPVMKRADILDELMVGKLGITVAGTHGKTTTTAMIAWMLTALGQDPTFIIGGVSLNLGTNARAGKGKAFVIEADEYDRMFLGLHPKVAVITNIEHDHPDCYPTPESYYQAFLKFAGQVDSDGAMMICKDDPGASRLLAETSAQGNAYAYSLQDAHCAGFASRVKPNSMGGFSFDAVLSGSGQPVHIPVTLTVPGVHNVLNALAAFLVADWLGLPLQGVAKALEEYKGSSRRFEIQGEAWGVIVVDDYAHHPTEIRATLAAARAKYPGRKIWAVWQPHTYSRTRALFADFAASFQDADAVVVTEVYAAREPVEADFSSNQLVAAMRHPAVVYAADFGQAVAYLLVNLHPNAVLLVFSAGDADQISAQVLAALKERSSNSAGQFSPEKECSDV